MAKANIIYKCSNCDASSPKWAGKCLSCQAWGTLEKMENVNGSLLGRVTSVGEVSNVITFDKVVDSKTARISTKLEEVDRCLGGGIVPGSVVLLGGDPGVGKSTLALQVAAGLLKDNINVLYVCGEESPAQVKIRANRMPGEFADLQLLPDTNLANILATVGNRQPDVVIVDSIQTLYNPDNSGVPGSVSQVSNAASRLVEMSKTNTIATILIGHVTKEGFIAGPKTLEHMVDVVLYIEGDRFQQLRLLRAVKNRFGGVNEVGVFEMAGSGLIEVSNPSKLFLDEETMQRSGSSMTCILEGTRVLACEIQALLNKTSLAYPKRTSVGFDQNRLWLLLAVLSKYGRLPVHEQDVYVNVVGGLKITEPACDLAVSCALASSLLDTPVPSQTVILGEIGLSGEIRPVSQIDRRLSEAQRLGFEKAVIPARQKVGKTKLELIRVGDIKEALKKLFKTS